MKKKKGSFYRSLFFLPILMFSVGAQAQVLGVKTNALAWGTASFNAGLEVGFAKKWTIDVNAIYNPFTWKEGKRTKILGIQPEVRFWPRYKFAGHFIGLHGHYAEYDWGLWKYRYKGGLFGGGISYGYALMIHKRWNIEGTVGFGLTRLDHDYRYDRKDSQSHFPPNPKNKWGLSKIGINITYLIR